MAKKGDKERERKIEEIERLKKRISELEKDVGDKGKSLVKTSEKNGNKKYVWILVLLILILIVVDLLSLIAYYKPDFSSWIKSPSDSNISEEKNGKCSDGTPENACSRNKPYFCYRGELLKNAQICGCPNGYELDFQDCVRI